MNLMIENEFGNIHHRRFPYINPRLFPDLRSHGHALMAAIQNLSDGPFSLQPTVSKFDKSHHRHCCSIL